MFSKILITNVTVLIIVVLSGCLEGHVKNNTSGKDALSGNSESELDSVSGNSDVAHYLKSFQGRGALSDSSKATSPQNALARFRHPADLSLDLVLSEPAITQPVELGFDYRGRLWVVQYNQYPYPKGLKITSVDNWLRVTFDKIPESPPNALKGADKVSFFEDTNGDGTYDKATDAITGLNIATSAAIGRGKIWVLNPPYLLAYPDPDGDGMPNGLPVVHLDGFGMQDTHAIASSLTWGPDGWLYGAQGSTNTSTINSSVTKHVFLQGQAIWRYNPESHVFERFAEGGGNNPFNIEIDEKGRVYSGSNSQDRGPVYKQGGYYIKSWGKHGPLSNPYAFGYLPNMLYTGDSMRFTHAFIKYEGGGLPDRYKGKLIAINPLLNYVQLTRLEPHGSSFKALDEERIMETNDYWFRPVDIQAGPDGAVYLADWYDSRLSHVDPRDNWNKATGRIYRLRNKDSLSFLDKFDLSTYSNQQLIELLSNKNEWFRKQAILVLGDRRDGAILPRLMSLFRSDKSQTALEALWAINASNGFTDKIAIEGLNHKDPFVRMWSVRLLGDANKVSPAVSNQLARLASRELDPEVRGQLASTAKRLPAPDAIHIIKNMLGNQNDANDPDIPLLIWWAIESKSESDRNAVLSIFEDRAIWGQEIIQKVILKRLMQRYIMAGGAKNFEAATRLLKLSPSVELSKLLVAGLQEGFAGRNLIELPPALVKLLKPFHTEFGDAPLTMSLRLGQKKAAEQALAIIGDNTADLGYRLAYVRIMGEVYPSNSVPVLLKLAENSETSAVLREAALNALPGYDMAEIGSRVISAYPILRSEYYVRIAALRLFAARTNWAQEFLKEIVQSKQISKEDVPLEIARSFKLLNDPTINNSVDHLWPDARLLTPPEKTASITKISKLLQSTPGDPLNGHKIFSITCGYCHKLFGEGGNIGPDLSGYDRKDFHTLLINIIDPNTDIREGYEVQRIVTADGRILEGKIVARGGKLVTIQPALGGKETVLSTDKIREIRPSSGSTMPERLLDKMPDQQIKDIFSYIMKSD